MKFMTAAGADERMLNARRPNAIGDVHQTSKLLQIGVQPRADLSSSPLVIVVVHATRAV